MTVNIKKLLREIFNGIRNNQPYDRAITYDVMSDKLAALESSLDTKKQEKMIYLVLGAILNDLQMRKVEPPIVKDYRASSHGALTYQTLDHFSGRDGKRLTLDELFYTLGRFIFLRINQDQVSKNNFLALFNSNHSYGNSFLHSNFLASTVQQLVDFCISHSDRLEVEEINLNHFSRISTRNGPESTPIKPVESEPLRPTDTNLGLLVLGGFVFALGIAAVALAFTVLSASTLGMSFVAIAGFAGLIGGLGLLCTGGYKHHQHVIDESYVELSDLEEHPFKNY